MGVFCGVCRKTGKYKDRRVYDPMGDWSPKISEDEEKELAMQASFFADRATLLSHMQEKHGIVGLHGCADNL
jgi:hypothetical protein